MENKKLTDLWAMIDEMANEWSDDSNLAKLQRYRMKRMAEDVFNAGFSKGFTAGVKEGKELEALKHLPHNQPDFINNVIKPVRWESVKK